MNPSACTGGQAGGVPASAAATLQYAKGFWSLTFTLPISAGVVSESEAAEVLFVSSITLLVKLKPPRALASFSIPSTAIGEAKAS